MDTAAGVATIEAAGEATVAGTGVAAAAEPVGGLRKSPYRMLAGIVLAVVALAALVGAVLLEAGAPVEARLGEIAVTVCFVVVGLAACRPRAATRVGLPTLRATDVGAVVLLAAGAEDAAARGVRVAADW